MGLGEALWTLRKHHHARVVLKLLSTLTGAFLTLAGIVGLSAILLGQTIYAVGSLYAIFFGLLTLVLEARDKMPLTTALYQLVDVYLKFMTFQRGKGMFYLAVGLLVLYIGPDGTHAWGLNNVAALILAIIGSIHTFKVIREEDPKLGPGADVEGPPADFRMPAAPLPPAATSGTGQDSLWSSMVNAVKMEN